MANKYKKRMVPNDQYFLGGGMANQQDNGVTDVTGGLAKLILGGMTGGAAMPLVNLISGQMADGGFISEFNTGGSHEQNPNGGIPVGNGKSVEQGETRNNKENYVYSDRLVIDEDLAKEYSLPKKAIGKSFADVSKMFKDDERPNDPIARRGAERSLSNLKDAQEAYKRVKLKSDVSAMPLVNLTDEQMALGGPLGDPASFLEMISALQGNYDLSGGTPDYASVSHLVPTNPINVNQGRPDDLSGIGKNYTTPISNMKDNKPGPVPQDAFDNNKSLDFKLDPSILRYAGTAGDLGALAYLFANKPEAKDINMFNTNNKFEENLVDRGQQIRDIDSSTGALLESIRNASGGNAATYLNNAASAIGRASTAKGQTSMASDVADAQEKARVQMARFQQDLYNQRNRMQTQNMNDQDSGQFDTNILDTLTNFANNLTSVGGEEYYKYLINNLPILYNIKGEFKGKDNG